MLNENESPVLSFIIPVYNGALFIERCVSSILKLKSVIKDRFNIIIVDDGSTDETYDICLRLFDEHNCIMVLKKANEGVSAARNFGLQHATGDYIIFVDADDEIVASNYPTLIQVINDSSPDIVSFDYYSCDKNGNSLKSEVLGMAIEAYGVEYADRYISCPYQKYGIRNKKYLGAKVFQYAIQRRVLSDFKLSFPVGIHYAEDTCFLFSVMQCVEKVVYCDSCLYKYYIMEGSASHRFRPNFHEEMECLYNYVVEHNSREIDISYLHMGLLISVAQYFSRYLSYREFKRLWSHIKIHGNYLKHDIISLAIKMNNIPLIYFIGRYGSKFTKVYRMLLKTD